MTTVKETAHLQEDEVPLKIYLNDGTVRYGFVVNDLDTTSGAFSFISSEKIKAYQVTKDNCLIEPLYPQSITAIDAYLK